MSVDKVKLAAFKALNSQVEDEQLRALGTAMALHHVLSEGFCEAMGAAHGTHAKYPDEDDASPSADLAGGLQCRMYDHNRAKKKAAIAIAGQGRLASDGLS